jgi:ABC-2 type transport system ATP-binding protein
LRAELEDGVLAMLGIQDFLKTPVRKMSGGMKKRLSIGCAIASDPKILLLDEPCAALDLVCKERILNYFRDFKARGGVLILATHDVQELELCDACYLLKEGTLTPYVYDGNVHRLVGCL